jgi:hypothetical protein
VLTPADRAFVPLARRLIALARDTEVAAGNWRRAGWSGCGSPRPRPRSARPGAVHAKAAARGAGAVSVAASHFVIYEPLGQDGDVVVSPTARGRIWSARHRDGAGPRSSPRTTHSASGPGCLRCSDSPSTRSRWPHGTRSAAPRSTRRNPVAGIGYREVLQCEDGPSAVRALPTPRPPQRTGTTAPPRRPSRRHTHRRPDPNSERRSRSFV